MITATARVLKNVIQVEAEKDHWLARPRGTGTTSVGRALSALFTTDYELYVEGAADKVVAHVSYNPKRDEIVVQQDEERWQTRSSTFGPMRVTLAGTEYILHEKITGKFALVHDDDVVAHGEVRFRSLKIEEYPAELQEVLARFALGFLIRHLFWELAF